MDELKELRNLVGPEADVWTTAQLEQLKRDIDAMAVLLLGLYRSRSEHRRLTACGSSDFDVPQTNR
jgi:hypothetical protein